MLRDQKNFVCGLSKKLHLSHCNQRGILGKDFWKQPHHHQLTPYEKRRDVDWHQEMTSVIKSSSTSIA